MQRLISLLFATALVFGQGTAAPTGESKILLNQVDDILKGLSEITGWKVRKPVPAEFIGKDQLREFVEKRMKEVIKPEDLRIESLTLRMFGLVPEDFDLEKATIDLVTEQAAAFYDYNEKRLYIIENSSSFLEQRVVLVHELAHALADQQFSLANYIKKGNQNDDDATAREAVMEGQATWLMWAYSSRLNGGEARPSETMLDLIRSETGSGATQYPVFDKSPLYMRESLVFPYNHGALFQEAVFDRYGKAGFSEVFRRAPRTSAQILHPEMYFSARQPAKLKSPEPPESKHYKVLAEGSVGEFDHRILLEQYVSKAEAARLAPHWRGGAFRLYEHKQDQHPVLTWSSEWDSPDAARSWLEAYEKVLRGKSRKLAGLDLKGGTCSGSNERGGFRVQRNETRVSAVEGLPATLN